jgi:hypothetical protein
MTLRFHTVASWLLAAWALTGLAGCALAPVSPDSTPPVGAAASRWAGEGVPDDPMRPVVWEHLPLPGKAATRFVYERKDGRDVVTAVAESSVSMKRRRLDIAPQDLGQVRFSWRVDDLIAKADMGRRDLDDSPVRIVLVFDGDRSRLSPADAMLSELARALTGEELPYATLMYVWCNARAPGEVILNPRTSRIRKLVVESGPRNLGQWLAYERDVRADYERAFGEAPGALRGVALMTDSDNTRSVARAWYGPVRLSAETLARRP